MKSYKKPHEVWMFEKPNPPTFVIYLGYSLCLLAGFLLIVALMVCCLATVLA